MLPEDQKEKALETLVIAEIAWDWRDRVPEYLADARGDARQAFTQMYVERVQLLMDEPLMGYEKIAARDNGRRMWDHFIQYEWPIIYRTEIEPAHREMRESLDRMLEEVRLSLMIPNVQPYWGWMVVEIDADQHKEVRRKIEWAQTAVLSL